MNGKCRSQDLLQETSIEPTPHRQQVLDVLMLAQTALTPDNILQKIHKTRTMDKVTLYRTLDLFVEHKIIRRIATGRGAHRYEVACQEHFPVHPHFVCRECGGIECLSHESLNDLSKKFGKYDVLKENIDLKLEGLCEKCREG